MNNILLENLIETLTTKTVVTIFQGGVERFKGLSYEIENYGESLLLTEVIKIVPTEDHKLQVFVLWSPKRKTLLKSF